MVTIPRYVFYLYIFLISLLSLFAQKVFAGRVLDMVKSMYSRPYFFGDSLSDNGNFAGIHNHLQSAPVIGNDEKLHSEITSRFYGFELVPRGRTGTNDNSASSSEKGYLKQLEKNNYSWLKKNYNPETNNYAHVGATSKELTAQIGVFLADKLELPFYDFLDAAESTLEELPETEQEIADNLLNNIAQEKYGKNYQDLNYMDPEDPCTKCYNYVYGPAKANIITPQIINFLLHSDKKLDPNANYYIWIGANDANPRRHFPISPEETAKNIRQGIDLFRAAGAKNIIVFTIPDLEQVIEATGYIGLNNTSFPSEANKLLKEEIASLPYPVTLRDINAMFVEILKNSRKFGIKNISKGIKLNHATGDNEDKIFTDEELKNGSLLLKEILFYDLFHPNGVGHRILSGLETSSIMAIGLPYSMLHSPRSVMEQTQQGLTPYLSNTTSIFDPIIFTQTGSHSPSVAFGDKVKTKSTAITLGASSNFAPHLTGLFALAFNQGHSKLDDVQIHSSYDLFSHSVNAGLGIDYPRFFSEIIFQGGWLHYRNIKRSFDLDEKYTTATGNTKGYFINASTQTGLWIFNQKPFRFGPFFELNHNRVKVDSFTEHNADSANLCYHSQYTEILQLGGGVRLEAQLTPSTIDTIISVDARASRHKNLMERTNPIRYYQVSSPLDANGDYNEVPREHASFTKVSVNLTFSNLKNKLKTIVGYNLYAQKRNCNHILNLGINYNLF